MRLQAEQAPQNLGVRPGDDHVNPLTKGICFVDLKMDCNIVKLLWGLEVRGNVLDAQVPCQVKWFLIYCESTIMRKPK